MLLRRLLPVLSLLLLLLLLLLRNERGRGGSASNLGAIVCLGGKAARACRSLRGCLARVFLPRSMAITAATAAPLVGRRSR